MTSNATHEGEPLAAVLEDLAASRGLTLAEMADKARRQGHDLTPAEIVNGAWSGFGAAADAALSLDASERRRVSGTASEGWGVPGVPRPGLVAPGLMRYRGENPREDGGPWCSVSCPDAGGPCQKPAVMEVWSISFCEVHGTEAEAAAISGLHEAAHEATREILDAARPRWRTNGALLEALREAEKLAQGAYESAAAKHETSAVAAYGRADPSLTDSQTLAFNGDLSSGTPVEWWGETRRALVRFMREAHEGGLPALLDALEPIRERATVQELLAVGHALSGQPA